MTPAPENGRSVVLNWLGTAGFHLQYRNTRILLDPHLTRPQPSGRTPLSADQAAAAQAILVTHGHFDHAMDVPYLASIGSGTVLAPADVCRRLAEFGIQRERLLPNERTVSHTVGDLKIDVLPSRHIRYDLPLIGLTILNTLRNRVFAEALGLGLSWPLGSNSDFLIHCGDISVFHAGSLGADPAQRAGLSPTVALLPCAGRSNMVSPLTRICDALAPGIVVLHHHDMFWPGFVLPQPARLTADLMMKQRPGLAVQVAQAGEPLTVGG